MRQWVSELRDYHRGRIDFEELQTRATEDAEEFKRITQLCAQEHMHENEYALDHEEKFVEDSDSDSGTDDEQANRSAAAATARPNLRRGFTAKSFWTGQESD